jgi:hypothetical protein
VHNKYNLVHFVIDRLYMHSCNFLTQLIPSATWANACPGVTSPWHSIQEC